MNPSLLLIPDRYKAAKLYSQIPDSGAGDLTFARNSNATRVNSAGLIEKVRTNLVLYSEEFDNAYWSKQNGTITANTQVAPDGTTTADTLTSDGGTVVANKSCIHKDSITPIDSNIYTRAIFLKKGNTRYAWLSTLGSSFTDSRGFIFDFDDEVVTLIFSVTAEDIKVEKLIDGWYRFSILIASSNNNSRNLSAGMTKSPTTFEDHDSGDFVHIWGAQLETGDIATDYIPTTTAAVSVGITADIPRLDYTGGGCPSLLLEPQRTNLVTFSEQFDNAGWSKLNSSTITANTSVSPSGYQDADKFQASNLAFGGILRQSPTVTSGVAYTFSFFCKKDNHRYVGIRFNTSTVGGTIIPTYDFDTNTFNSQGVTGVTLSSQLYANGWVRVILTYTSTTIIGLCDICIVPSDGDTATALTGTEAILVWGAQLEVGSYVSSYIPTLGSSVTRLADAGGNKTSASALIGQAQGTMFLEVQVTQNTPSDAAVLLGVFDSTAANNRIQIVTRLGFLQTYIEANSVGYVVNQTLATLTAGTTYKVALAYSSAGIVVYINGASVYTNTSALAFTATLETISVGSRAAIDTFGQGERIASSALYTTRLTNAELAALTAL
jgi:hypothetical protein